MKKFAVIFLLCTPLFAQTKEAPTETQPKLSAVEITALQTVFQKLSQLATEEQQVHRAETEILEDIDSRHPGYHFDIATQRFVKLEAAKKK